MGVVAYKLLLYRKKSQRLGYENLNKMDLR